MRAGRAGVAKQLGQAVIGAAWMWSSIAALVVILAGLAWLIERQPTAEERVWAREITDCQTKAIWAVVNTGVEGDVVEIMRWCRDRYPHPMGLR